MKRMFFIIGLITLLFLVDVSTAQGSSLPDSAYISGLTGHAQGYAISCESRSAADLAAFWGISIGETEFLQALPQSDNPEKGFVGDPNESWGYIPPHGYGVHATPVANTLQSFGLDAIGLSDLSWDDLRSEINAGQPVIVWIIGSMWGGTPVNYEAQDGSTARVAAYEHTVILTGYSPDTVQVVNASNGQYQTYPLNKFLRSWEVLGNMAVFASPQPVPVDEPAEIPPRQPVPADEPAVELTPQPVPAVETPPGSYIVQPGDYVIALARRFGIPWTALAELNSISFPYVIHPGQVLQIPGNEKQEAEPQPVPDITEPVPVGKKDNFLARLPMVQRNYRAQTGQYFLAAPTSIESIQQASVSSSYSRGHFASWLSVDWQLLGKLKDLLLPYLIHAGELLKLQ